MEDLNVADAALLAKAWKSQEGRVFLIGPKSLLLELEIELGPALTVSLPEDSPHCAGQYEVDLLSQTLACVAWQKCFAFARIPLVISLQAPSPHLLCSQGHNCTEWPMLSDQAPVQSRPKDTSG